MAEGPWISDTRAFLDALVLSGQIIYLASRAPTGRATREPGRVLCKTRNYMAFNEKHENRRGAEETLSSLAEPSNLGSGRWGWDPRYSR